MIETIAFQSVTTPFSFNPGRVLIKSFVPVIIMSPAYVCDSQSNASGFGVIFWIAY